MKKVFDTALGIVTSVGGFLEIGSLATSMQAGAEYGFRLLWAIVAGTLCAALLIEMSGRLAAVGHRSVADAVRDRFGFPVFLVTLIGVGVSSFLVLVAEVGGVCLALQLASGVGFPLWAVPVGCGVWLLLWKAKFDVLEYGVSTLGLVTLVFLAAAVKLHPPVSELASGIVPHIAGTDARYWFIAVSILGATLTPYLFYFFSSGALEDHWDESHLFMNRVVAGVGMSFGGGLAAAVLVVAALVFLPRGIRLDQYDQAALLLLEPFGRIGFWLFVAALGIACLGAVLEVTLAIAYVIAQGFGWKWGEDVRPRKASRFATVYTVLVVAAALMAATGVDPLALTTGAMVLSSALLPVTVVPFLIIMNDPRYLGVHVNGWLANAAVVCIVILAFGLAVVSLPLTLIGR